MNESTYALFLIFSNLKCVLSLKSILDFFFSLNSVCSCLLQPEKFEFEKKHIFKVSDSLFQTREYQKSSAADKGGGHCVLKWGFMRRYPRNQDVTVKLKCELIFLQCPCLSLLLDLPSESVGENHAHFI